MIRFTLEQLKLTPYMTLFKTFWLTSHWCLFFSIYHFANHIPKLANDILAVISLARGRFVKRQSKLDFCFDFVFPQIDTSVVSLSLHVFRNSIFRYIETLFEDMIHFTPHSGASLVNLSFCYLYSKFGKWCTCCYFFVPGPRGKLSGWFMKFPEQTRHLDYGFPLMLWVLLFPQATSVISSPSLGNKP